MSLTAVARWIAPAFFAAHLGTRIFIPKASIATDLILYNLVLVAALITLFWSDEESEPLIIASVASAFAAWGLGSIIYSAEEFFELPASAPLIADIAYFLFYPFILIALLRTLISKSDFSSVEILDSTIFGLGLISVFTALLLPNIAPRYLESQPSAFDIASPLLDLVLLILIAILIATHRATARTFLFAGGVSIFVLTDFYFLWLKVESRYIFAGATDDGWLLGIILISLALWSKGDQGGSTLHPLFLALSVFTSPILLAVIALSPGAYPTFIFFPTITTLFLAFARMTIVLRESSEFDEEKVLARTDELTGLPNRRRLVAELALLRDRDAALMLLDLDGFKPVNDQYGHETGDEILQQVSHRFSRALPGSAILARLGGDEFGVLVEGRYESTIEIAHALHATLSYPFNIRGQLIHISVSIGYVQNDGDEGLLARADAAMYEAKRSGSGVSVTSS